MPCLVFYYRLHVILITKLFKVDIIIIEIFFSDESAETHKDCPVLGLRASKCWSREALDKRTSPKSTPKCVLRGQHSTFMN